MRRIFNEVIDVTDHQNNKTGESSRLEEPENSGLMDLVRFPDGPLDSPDALDQLILASIEGVDKTVDPSVHTQGVQEAFVNGNKPKRKSVPGSEIAKSEKTRSESAKTVKAKTGAGQSDKQKKNVSEQSSDLYPRANESSTLKRKKIVRKTVGNNGHGEMKSEKKQSKARQPGQTVKAEKKVKPQAASAKAPSKKAPSKKASSKKVAGRKQMSPEKVRLIKSMYFGFNALIEHLSIEINMIHPRHMQTFCLWQQTNHPIIGLTLKQRRVEQMWADAMGTEPIKSHLNLGHLKSILHHFYVWCCENIGPVETDQLFADAVKEVSRKPEARYFPPRSFL